MVNELARCRVVLIRTHYAGNIGAVARAMANFGLTDLVFVDPVADPLSHEARWMATNGGRVLETAKIAPDFENAVADCQQVLGTSAATFGVLRETIRGGPDELLPAFATTLETGPSALVFGPEPHGLTTEEISRCHALLHLPTDPGYPALNLSLCVGLALYELRKTVYRTKHDPNPRLGKREPTAVFAEFERAMAHLELALAAVGFLHGPKADALMHAIRHLIARAAPTPQEIKLLHGLAKQLLHVSNSYPPDGKSDLDQNISTNFS